MQVCGIAEPSNVFNIHMAFFVEGFFFVCVDTFARELSRGPMEFVL